MCQGKRETQEHAHFQDTVCLNPRMEHSTFENGFNKMVIKECFFVNNEHSVFLKHSLHTEFLQSRIGVLLIFVSYLPLPSEKPNQRSQAFAHDDVSTHGLTAGVPSVAVTVGQCAGKACGEAPAEEQLKARSRRPHNVSVSGVLCSAPPLP